jgi:hypothetical protein
MISIGDQVRVIDLAQNIPYYLWGEVATVIDSTGSIEGSSEQFLICFDGSEAHFALARDIETFNDE